MRHRSKLSLTRQQQWGAMLLVAAAGFATAALVGTALARSFTLEVASNAKVVNAAGATKSENIVVGSRGFALYDLGGETAHHPLCTKTKGCFKFWPPLTVASARKLSKAPGIKGRLGVWHRDGFFQVTLGGHPLYRFAPDNRKHVATGEGIRGFGGTWHVITAGTPNATSTTVSAPGTTTTSTGTSTSSATSTYSAPTSTTYSTPTSTTSSTTTPTSTTTTTTTTTTYTYTYPPAP